MTTAGERSTPSHGDEQRKLLTGCAYALTVIVGFTVLLVSGNYLHEYAHATGMTGWLAWTLVVALEAGGAGGTLGWFSGKTASVILGRRIALANLAASVLGNIVGHLLGTGSVHASAVLVVLTGAVYPAELWAMVHLALVLRSEHRGRPVPTSAAETELPAPAEHSSPASPGASPPAELHAHQLALATPTHQPAGDTHPPGELPAFSDDHQDARPPAPPASDAPANPHQSPTPAGDVTSAPARVKAHQLAKVRELVKQGMGRQAIASHLAITPHQARQLIASVATETRQPPARQLRAVGGVTR